MLGGRGTPCIQQTAIPEYKKQFGRPCPRIELHSINEDASQIVMLALNQYTQPIVPAYVSMMDPAAVCEAMDRAVVVLSSSELHDMLKKAGEADAAKRRVQDASKHVRHIGRR